MVDKQDATALLPCPFCGANNPEHMYSEYCRELTSPGFNREQSRIWCSICGATVIKKNCEEAIRAWNTRATSQTPAAVREIKPQQADGRGAVIEEWRAARQDVFDNTTKIADENTERWKRLSSAEHALMEVARAALQQSPGE